MIPDGPPQVEEEDLESSQERSAERASSQPSNKPKRYTDMFTEFALHHSDMLERLIKENQNRVRQVA